MTDKILIDRSVVEQALNWAIKHGEKVYAAGGFESIDSMNAWAEALRAALEQPQVKQEPVAWAVMQGGAICWEADYPFSNEPGWCDSDQQSVPLYIHPQPPRQLLTDDEIERIWYQSWGGALPFARNIERVYGIGE